jgi:hypothetical protein
MTVVDVHFVKERERKRGSKLKKETVTWSDVKRVTRSVKSEASL